MKDSDSILSYKRPDWTVERILHSLSFGKAGVLGEFLGLPFEELETSLARYLWLRLQDITGNGAAVEKTLTSVSALSLGDLEAALIHAHRDALQARNLDSHITRIESFKQADVQSPYLRAELFFALGILHSRNNQFLRSIQEYERAKVEYQAAGLGRQVGITVLNICISANHLNLQPLLENASREFEQVVQTVGDPALQAFYHRFQGNRAMDVEDWDSAQAHLTKASELLLGCDRIRDYRTAISYLAYIALKKADLGRFQECLAAFGKSGTLDDLVQTRMDYFARVSEIPFFSLNEAESILKECRCRKVDGISLVFILDLVFEGLLRSKAHEDILKFYRKVRRVPQLLEQAEDLVDYRYYPVVAWFCLGYRTEANQLLAQYRSEAIRSGSQARLRKSRQIAKTFGIRLETRAKVPAEGEKGDARGNEGSRFTLDLPSHQLRSDEKIVYLVRQPLLERFFEVLFRNPHGVELSDLYQRCYGTRYNPILHQARFYSLIARAKRMMQDEGALLWRDGIVQFNPNLLGELIEETARTRETLRLSELLTHIRSLNTAVSVSALQARYPLSRRSLQQDLVKLVRSGHLIRAGRGRGASYMATGESVCA